MHTTLAIALAFLTTTTNQPTDRTAQPAEPTPHILFIRGAERSGGFMYRASDANLTAQLADVTDTTSNQRNTGFAMFAETLREAGFEVTQMIEPLEPNAPATGQTTGAPLPFDQLDLDAYDLIVMGSNNAVYEPAQIDAIQTYIESGGGVLFIADANFGSDWADSTASDQQFLDRFGWTIQQDQGTYALSRDAGDFIIPDHPILKGVEAFDGEGVSPVVIPETDIEGVHSELIVRAKPGAQTRNNDGDRTTNNGQGSSRKTTPQDAALAIGSFGDGMFAVHFDRNTFFNTGGQGTDITRFDNEQLGINLVRHLTETTKHAFREW